MALIIPDEMEEAWACKHYNIVNWQKDTLVDLVQHRAETSPSMVLYTLLDSACQPVHSLTSTQLDSQASLIAAGLHHFGKERDRVLILCENDLNYILAFFGCLYANMIPVSGIHVDMIRSDERFETVLKDAQPKIIIGPRHILSEFKIAFSDLNCQAIWVPLDVLQNSKDGLVRKGHNEDVAFIQYSSGTTKHTKGILITNRNLLYNARRHPIHEKFSDENSSELSWLPFAHDLGLIGGIIAPVGIGRQIVLLPPKYFIEKPIRWLQAITKYRVKLSGGPTFAYNLCIKEITDEEVDSLDLSSWELAVNGADSTQAEVMEKFCQKFAKANFKARNFVFGYGLAEATLTVTRTKMHTSPKIRNFSRKALMAGFARSTANPADKRVMIACGRSFEDQKVVIVDPETCHSLRNGRIGEIWVKGPSIAKGYFNRPEETAEVFHAQLVGSDDFYLRTGDLGFIFEDELYFSGRMSNVITLRNKKYDPSDISGVLENACGDLRINGTAFFLNDPDNPVSITIIAEIVRDPVEAYEVIAEQIYKKVTEIYDIWPQTIALTRAGGVLKTPSGKIQIARTRQAFHEKKLPLIQEFHYEVPEIPPLLSFHEAYKQIEAWIREETKEWKEDVKALTRSALVKREISTELLLGLRHKFETHFHVEIDPSEFTVACQTYTDLCNLLAKQISNPVV